MKNNLKKLYPELAKEWHPIKNGNLKVEDFTTGSGKKVWWQCSKGHEWQASINNRTWGRKCPYCSNKKLLRGYNDLATVYPDISKEWHPIKNEDLKASDVISGSRKKVWWKCSKGHEWQATIDNRVKKMGTKCPFCSGNLVIKGENDLATMYPKIAKEWHPTKNGSLKPEDFKYGTHKKIWWQCSKGHEWQASIINRVRNRGCPYCGNKKVLQGYNDLATIYPEIAKEWHPTKNGDLNPTDILFGSAKRVWWQCSKGHEWQAIVYTRTKENCKCPYCLGRLSIKGENDLATIYPEIAKEWHPTKNGDLKPIDFTIRAKKKVWWRCCKGHEWESFIYNRTGKNKSNCPHCSIEKNTSFPELAIFYYIKKVFNDAISGDKNYYGQEIDIYIPSLKIGIEYDGYYWHKNKLKQDIEKSINLCKNIKLLRIREHGLKSIDLDNCFNYIRENNYNNTLDNAIHWIFDFIEKQFNISTDLKNNIKNLKISVLGDEINISNLINYIEKDNSLKSLYPEIAKEWHPIKNGDLTSSTVAPFSSKRVWWQCSKGHEWQVSISRRTKQNSKCPYCANKKLLHGFNDLATVYPEIAKEWHPTKNSDLKPINIIANSSKRVWWKCCEGHEWQTSINYRAKQNSKCPYCANKKLLHGFNDLATVHPEIAKEWHPTKNSGLQSSQVLYGSGNKVWWQCAKGHEWQAIIYSRTGKNKAGCPYCRKSYNKK